MAIMEHLLDGGLVILSDADLTDVSINYVKALAPESKVFRCHQQNKGQKSNVFNAFHSMTCADASPNGWSGDSSALPGERYPQQCRRAAASYTLRATEDSTLPG